jgi:DNA primase
MADSRSAYNRGDAGGRSAARRGVTADEIRERTNIVEIIAPHVTLKRAGKRLAGLCPFHPDKAPSFTVDPDKGLWHCFGCGAGGNVFHFLERAENLTFPEAARKLAERLGLEFRGRREDARARDERELLARINGEAARFFQRELAKCAPARDYLSGRGLGDDIISRFMLGWAPGAWDALYKHLRRQGHRDADIENTGLCVARRSGDGCYDRFRARIMFPILDADERVIAFSGRIIEGYEPLPGQDRASEPTGESPAAQQPGAERGAPSPKYINSPETALFRKGRTLYAFPFARKAMGDRGRAILVEGQFDVIACHAAGYTETVATLGTALTEDHVQVLRRHTGRVYAAYDSDSAGMKAVLRGQELFEAARLEVRIISLPQGADPDSFLRERGADALGTEIDNAMTAMDYRLAVIAAGHPDTEDGQLAMLQEAVEALSSLRDAVAQTHYIRRLAERWCRGNVDRVRLMEQALHQELRKRAPRIRRSREGPAQPPSAALRVERQVLAAIVQSEVIARRLLGELCAEDFCDGTHRRAFERLIQKAEAAGALNIEEILDSEQEADLCALVSGLAMAEDAAACSDAELREAVERMREWRDARRCKELLEKEQSTGLANEERLELTELKRQHGRLTARRSIGQEPA